MGDDRKYIACCCGVFPVLLYIILMAMSYKVLSPLESGVKKNTISNAISDKLFSSGRHYVNPTHTFIIFPTTLQTIEFSYDEDADAPPLKIPTEGGQIIIVELSFQYRLMTSKLAQLYKSYEVKFKSKYISIARGSLQIHGANFPVTQWYQNRIQIGQSMHSYLNELLQREYFCSIEHFQLRNIKPPFTINKNILQKAVSQEATNLEREKKEAKKTRAQAQTLVAEYTKEERIVNATADYKAKVITNSANALSIKITLEKKASAYKQLKDSLNFTNSEFLRYKYINVIRNAKSPDKIISNMDSAFFSQNF